MKQQPAKRSSFEEGWINFHLYTFAWLSVTVCLGFPIQALGQEKAEKQDSEQKASEKQEDQQDGEDTLHQALELSQKAKSMRDLDKVVDLLDQALKQGLEEESAKMAKNMLQSTLENQVKQRTALILKVPRDPRWRPYRREALNKLRRIQELDPKNVNSLITEARLESLPGGERDKAKAAMEKAKKLAGDDKKKQAEILLLGAALSEDPEKRLAELDKVLKLDSKNVRALMLRALQYERMEKKEEAIKDYEAIAKIQPENLVVRERLLQAYRALKKFDKAVEIIDQMIDKEDDNQRLYVFKAQLLVDGEKAEQAAEVLEEALEIDDSNIEVLLMQAQVYNRLGEFQKSLDAAEYALEYQPGLPGAIIWRSMANAGLENFDDAIKDIKSLMGRVRGEQKRAFQLQLASLYVAADRHDEAIKLFDKLLEEKKDDSALRGRGDAYLGSGDHGKAIKDYEQALKLKEDNSGVLNNLAWLLSTTPIEDLRDGKRAIELSKKAAELTEFKQAHILSTLASSYAEADDFENAMKWAAKAVEVGIEEKSTQLDDLKRELEAYKANKKWREYKDKSGPEGDVEFDLE